MHLALYVYCLKMTSRWFQPSRSPPPEIRGGDGVRQPSLIVQADRSPGEIFAVHDALACPAAMRANYYIPFPSVYLGNDW
jgi:hypothetical protein